MLYTKRMPNNQPGRTGLLMLLAILTLGLGCASLSGAQSKRTYSTELPAWIDQVGARTQPQTDQVFLVGNFGAKGDGTTLDTKAIQDAIDKATATGGGIVMFAPGTYLTGAIYLRDNVHLKIDEGVTLKGSQNDDDYPEIWTRVAGIEMNWPSALINVNDCRNVKVSGGGTIDGNGKKWWDYYWDLRRNDYEPRGIRWAADYDAKRVRLMVVWESEDVTVENLSLKRSGFWTVQVVYSQYVTVDGIKISDNAGPSTDGVDVDSSSWILVQNCEIDNNDDCICLKAGRDWDGLRVDKPCEYVVVRNNTTYRGGGVLSFGSETAGWIRHVVCYNNTGIGTKQGTRFKSAWTRGGGVEDVLIRDNKLIDVPKTITFTSNWNPSYSYASIPEGIDNVPQHWITMNTPVEPKEKGWPVFRDIVIANLEIEGATKIVEAEGLPGRPLENIHLVNITARGDEAGSLKHIRNLTVDNVTFITKDGKNWTMEGTSDIQMPNVKKAE